MYGNGIAFVTGAAGGLGRATAVMLANRGFKVSFADMAFMHRPVPCELLSLLKSQDQTLFCGINVTDEDSIESALQQTEKRFGQPPSLVVHCAGVTTSKALFDEKQHVHSQSLFNRMVDINTNGTFNVTRLSAKHMLDIPVGTQEERGLIISTSSITGYQGSGKQIAYSSSKAAVIGMTLPLARALGPYGIRFNSIAPGMFYTPMLKGYEEIVEAMVDMIPFPKRLGIPDDFVKTVDYLMNCHYVNGTVLRVDGGIRFYNCLFHNCFAYIEESSPKLIKKSIPTAITGLSTYIQKCKEADFLNFLRMRSIPVESLEYEEYAIQLNVSNNSQSYSDDVTFLVLSQYLRPIVMSFQLIALPDTILTVPFEELQVQLGKWGENHYTIYHSYALNITFYCGPKEYYMTALTVINRITDKSTTDAVVPNISDLSVRNETGLEFDNHSEPGSLLQDNHSFHSAPSIAPSNQYRPNALPSDNSAIPAFSLAEGIYTPKHTIFCDGKLSYIYTELFYAPPLCSKLVIGNGSEVIDYFIVFRGDLLRKHLSPTNGFVKGYYYNRCGWYIVVQGSTKQSISILQSSYQDLSKEIVFPNREKLVLPLNEREFIKVLIFVSEVAQGQVTVHQVNDREVILLGNEPWFSRIKDVLQSTIYREVEVPDRVNDLVNSFDGLLKPIQKINSGGLQSTWSKYLAARGLDTHPIGFACFMSRCKRQVLVNFIITSLSIPESSVLNIIHCTEGFFIVFAKNSAPSRDRWKKYKNKIMPESFEIQYQYQPITPTQQNANLEEIRNEIEKLSNNNATIHWENRQLYIVGEKHTVESVLTEHPEIITPFANVR